MKIPFFNWIARKPPKTEKRGIATSSLSFGTLTSSTTALNLKSMQLSAVYRCIEVISDAVASLPFEPYKSTGDGNKQVDNKHITYDLLNLAPNKIHSRFTFIKMMVSNILMNGNAFAYIERDANGNAICLRWLNPGLVSIFYDFDETFVTYRHPKVNGGNDIPSDNIIHLLNFTYDGFRGVSTLQHAIMATDTARSADLHAQGFFSGGANLSGVLAVKGGLDDGQALEIQTKWRTALNPDTGNPNGIIVIEGDDMDFKPVSVNPKDAQMLESRQFSVVEICRFFGVSPTKAFDLTQSTQNNIEQSNLSFLTDTLTPLIEKIENEFNRKIFRPSERKKYSVQFDVTTLLRSDLQTQSEYYSKMFQIGVFQTNDIRKKLNMSPVEGGDVSFVQGALLPITYDFTAKNQVDNKQKTLQNAPQNSNP